MHWVLKSVVILVAVVLLAFLALAAVLRLPAFSGLRADLVSGFLSDQIGQPVVVEEDVAVHLGLVTKVNVSGLRIDTTNMEQVQHAEMDVFSLDIDILALLNDELDLDNLQISGLRIDADLAGIGTSEDTDEGSEGWRDAGEGQLLSFLRTRTVDITDIHLFIEDSSSGFEYDFQLEELTLDQVENGTALEVSGGGSVNDETFDLSAYFPDERPFELRFEFATAELLYAGSPKPGGYEVGYDAEISVDVPELEGFFHLVKLAPAPKGSARLSSRVSVDRQTTGLSDLTLDVDLARGYYLGVTGNIVDLMHRDGVELAGELRLYPEGQPPERAQELKDLRLTDARVVMRSDAGEIEFDEVFFSTNYFAEELNEVGPARIGKIGRSPEGALFARDLYLQVGPHDDPYVVTEGYVDSVLDFVGLMFTGRLNAPASVIMARLGSDVAAQFGRIEGEFTIDDESGYLELAELSARAADTDIWNLDARAKTGDVKTLDGLEIDLAFGVVDGADFLSALKLDPVDTGPLQLDATVRGREKGGSIGADVVSGSSDLSLDIEFDVSDATRSVMAELISKRFDVAAMKDAASALSQLKFAAEKAPEEAEVPTDEIPLQPLILPPEESSVTDLVDEKEILLKTQMEARIAFERIVGVPGLSSATSDFRLQDGKAQLGPLDFAIEGGQFSLQADMDLIETPHLIAVAGSTRGWDLGDILETAGVKIAAKGPVSGNFSISGNSTSINSFLNSMYGRAELGIGNGQIGTSLLELAGLGIFPWLFSKEREKGYTDIVCVKAPIKISAGRVSFDSMVAETRSVQLVARGYADWNADAIDLRADPRPVGRPLGAAPWPFEVSGKLSKPDFSVLTVESRRQRRADGADQMPANRTPCVPDILQLQ